MKWAGLNSADSTWEAASSLRESGCGSLLDLYDRDTGPSLHFSPRTHQLLEGESKKQEEGKHEETDAATTLTSTAA